MPFDSFLKNHAIPDPDESGFDPGNLPADQTPQPGGFSPDAAVDYFHKAEGAQVDYFHKMQGADYFHKGEQGIVVQGGRPNPTGDDLRVRRGAVQGILIGLMQFSLAGILIGLLIFSIVPTMAKYDGPIGGFALSIADWIRPSIGGLCERLEIPQCFGYVDLDPDDDDPESSHQNMPGLCWAQCDPNAAANTCAEGLECKTDASGAGYCYSETSALCVITPTPQTQTGGGQTGGGQQPTQPGNDPCLPDHGGMASYDPAYCNCNGTTSIIIFCADGTRLETPNTGTCQPDPNKCQQPSTDGGGQTDGGQTDGGQTNAGQTDGGTTDGGSGQTQEPPTCEYKCYVTDPANGKCMQGGWVYPGTDLACDPNKP